MEINNYRRAICQDHDIFRGAGESTFLNMLKKVNRLTVTDGNTLTFIKDDVALMRFTKKVTGKG